MITILTVDRKILLGYGTEIMIQNFTVVCTGFMAEGTEVASLTDGAFKH